METNTNDHKEVKEVKEELEVKDNLPKPHKEDKVPGEENKGREQAEGSIKNSK